MITPTFNGVDFLPRALNSVTQHRYPDIEHVVIDGGSTDGTRDLLERNPTIRWISEPDRGLSDAMNKGIAMATGDLIGWLNADDWYLPGALQAVADAAAAHPEAEWFTGRCPIVDNGGKEIRKPVTAYKNALLRAYSLPLYLTQNFISCPATFVRREAYEAIGPLRLDLHYSMDYDMFLRLAKRGDPVILKRDLAVFMMDEGTKSMSGFEEQFREHHEVAREHGTGHPFALGANAVTSRTITLAYRGMRTARRNRFR